MKPSAQALELLRAHHSSACHGAATSLIHDEEARARAPVCFEVQVWRRRELSAGLRARRERRLGVVSCRVSKRLPGDEMVARRAQMLQPSQLAALEVVFVFLCSPTVPNLVIVPNHG